MYSVHDSKTLLLESFLIQTSPDRRLFGAFPKLIAANHVFHRFLLPGNPPYALHSLIIKYLKSPALLLTFEGIHSEANEVIF